MGSVLVPVNFTFRSIKMKELTIELSSSANSTLGYMTLSSRIKETIYDDLIEALNLYPARLKYEIFHIHKEDKEVKLLSTAEKIIYDFEEDREIKLSSTDNVTIGFINDEYMKEICTALKYGMLEFTSTRDITNVSEIFIPQSTSS